MPITHKEFTKKWYGKSYTESPELGVQCVGGVKKYGQELGLGIKSFGGSAINGWNTGCPFDKTWKRVPYKIGMYPKEGDIIFWSEARCKFGHVAVANNFCNPFLLRYFDQNGTGKGDPYIARFGTYKNVLGFYTKIK